MAIGSTRTLYNQIKSRFNPIFLSFHPVNRLERLSTAYFVAAFFLVRCWMKLNARTVFLCFDSQYSHSRTDFSYHTLEHHIRMFVSNGHLGVTCIDNNQQTNRKINMQGHPLKITSPIIVADIKIMDMNGLYDSRYLELVYSRGSSHTTRN